MAVTLPPPDAAATAHAVRVGARLADAIAGAGGALPFSDWMRIALYEPGLGYYSAGARKFGVDGDFVTAPELSPLFGRCVARQCAELLEACDGDTVLELGPGSGALAAEVLLELERRERLPQHYLMLEVSADLRARQQERIGRLPARLAARVTWLDALPAGPLTGTVIGNEVLDALPATVFRIADGAVLERCVMCSADGFEWTDRPADAALTLAVRAIEADLGHALPDGYVSELLPGLPALIATWAALIGRGGLLFIDYGLPRRERYHAMRAAGTLTAHYRHRAHHEPFLYPGLQDLTTWVDFTAVADHGTRAGLALAGYTTQAHFLLGNGLAEFCGEPVADERAQLARSRDAQLLTLPDEMGERFKAIALVRDVDRPLSGFALRDLAWML
jgi:SAM-dependent MidA family methyltransferase